MAIEPAKPVARRWEELLLYKLEGVRFDAHDGVDLRDLSGLYHLRMALLEIAKHDFRHRLGRRAPNGADELLDVRIRAFEDGCVQARVFLGRTVPSDARSKEPPAQTSLFDLVDPPTPLGTDEEFLESVHRAAKLVEVALAAADREESLPAWMPNDTFDLLRNVAPLLRGDDRLTITAARPAPPDLLSEPARYASSNSESEGSHTSSNVRPIEATEKQPESGSNEDSSEEWRSIEIEYAQAARSASAPQRPSEDPPPRDDFGRGRSEPPPASGTPVLPATPTGPKVTLPVIPPLVNRDLQQRLEQRAEQERRGRAEAERLAATRVRVLEGEARMADLDGHLAALLLADGSRVLVAMSKEHEEAVTTSLRDHQRVRLRVSGLALHSQSGAAKEIRADRVAIVKPPDPDVLSEEMFLRLASEDRERLVNLLEPGILPPHLLTYAAEIAGRELSSEVVILSLLRLVEHTAPVVREGAIHGLSHHLNDERVVKTIRELAGSDSSLGVRAAAEGVLEMYEQ